MKKGIFSENASKYWDRGIPVIPLFRRDKRPAIHGWSQWAEAMPDAALREQWLREHGDGNIGVVCGPQSGLIMVDIDTTDPRVEKIILDNLGVKSPWRRIGKKGMVLAYKYNGIPTFRIKDIANNTLVEVLSARTQVVLPPSVHPDTGRPYESDRELLDVIDQLPCLDPQIEAILRGALLAADPPVELSHSGWTKVSDWVPAGARDVTMTGIAGLYAHCVIRGEIPVVRGIEQLKAWAADRTEQVAGDDVDVEKGIRNFIRFLIRDVHERNKVLPKGWDDGLTEDQKKEMGLEFSEDHQEWSFDELKDYLLDQFSRHDVGTPGRMTAIEYVLGKVARATQMTSLDEDRLLKYIAEIGGDGLSLSALRRRIRDLQAGGIKGSDHTEIAKAVIEDLQQYAPLRYYASEFWTWAGAHWVKKPKGDILRHIATEYGHLPAARKATDHRGIMQTVEALLDREIRKVDIEGVNFANGVLMLNGQLKPHDPDFGFTYVLPFRYLPEESGRAVKFEQFLHDCWGEHEDFEEKKRALQEALCATIFGYGPKLQRAILLHGPAKSGKSTLLTVAASLVPDSARSNVAPEDWGDKFKPTKMHGALINICGELSHDRKIDGQRFKSIIDGIEMQGQYKGQQIFDFKPMCTHWFASNHLPRTDDPSDGFNRRWLILKFTHPITAKRKRVLDYGNQLVAEEREAIIAWAIEALPRLREKAEFTLPPSHEEVLSEVANLNNSVRFFITESGIVQVVPQAGSKTPGHISERTLHAKYFDFCLGAGAARPVGPREFRQRMSELGVELGFKPRISRTAHGTPEVVYDGLTLVERRAA